MHRKDGGKYARIFTVVIPEKLKNKKHPEHLGSSVSGPFSKAAENL